jgi:hypothetical protein
LVTLPIFHKYRQLSILLLLVAVAVVQELTITQFVLAVVVEERADIELQLAYQ